MHKHTELILEWKSIEEKLNNLCFSPLGQQKIDNLDFIKSINDVWHSLSETYEMTQIIIEEQFPHVNIHNINSELERASKENSYLYADELIIVYEVLKSSREIRQYILSFEERCPILYQLSSPIETFKHIEDNIFRSIDPDGKITDQASNKLREVRSEIRRKKSKLERRLYQYIHNKNYSNIIQDSIVTTRENRFVIPIKKDQKGKLKGIVLDTSGSGETLFIEPEDVVEENNNLIGLLREEKEEELRILKRLTKAIRDKLNQIFECLNYISYIDLVYSKAKLSIEFSGVRPELNNNGIYKLFQATHPLLKQSPTPINILLGDEYKMLIITGPNTGGKTVALKTLGLLVLLTTAGILIPVKEGSTISIPDEIFIDSGDEQSIEQNLSTFSGHIKQIIEILNNATKNSLVLIDELGAGTDPEEGSSLGISILDKLREINCPCIVTTHYTKIKNYHLMYPEVENASCDFDLDTLKPLYKLIYGFSGKSNALDIAKRLGLNESIIERAKNIIEEDTTPEDRFIDNIHEEKEKIARLSERYNQKLQQLSTKESELNVREDILEKELRELKRLKLIKEHEIIADTRKKVLKLFDKAKSSIHDMESLKESLSSIETIDSSIQKELDELDEPIYQSEEVLEWKIGDIAFVNTLNRSGKIHDIKKSSVTVQIGDIKVSTHLSDLKKTNITPQNTISNDKSKFSYQANQNLPPYELILLGLRTEEAVKETDKYIEQLYTTGTEKGRIIHGKGSGILRTFIEEHLRKNPLVKSFNLANPDEGGYGVTEVFII